MKRTFLLLITFALAMGSCTKEYVNPVPDDNTGNTNGTGGTGGTGGSGGGGGGVPTIGDVPTTFSQKALVEEFTGEWCGYCPDGALSLRDVEADHPGKAIGASIHDNDPFSMASGMNLETIFDVASLGWPSGMVNRVAQGGTPLMDRGQWGGAVGMQLANTAVCGLAMSSFITGADTLHVEVHCGFNTTLSGDYRVTVYLEEDDVPAIAQHNYYNTPGNVSPDNTELNNIGDPIANWFHDDVVRKVLTADLGDVIPSSAMISHGEFVTNYTTTITGYDKNKCKVVAFINLVGTDVSSHQVMNVQSAKVYEVKNWD